jgi:hypothetical protein
VIGLTNIVIALAALTAAGAISFQAIIIVDRRAYR